MNAPLAEFRTYDELRKALNVVRNYRQMPFRVMNDLIGCQEGYFEKILGPRPVKRVGMQSLGWAFGALGVKCIIVEDPEAWAKIERHSRFETRDHAHFVSSMHADGKHHVVTWRFLKKISRSGGKGRAAKLTKPQLKKIARKAAKVRWAKQRRATHKARLTGANK